MKGTTVSITANCPSCDHQFTGLKGEHAGKRATCKNCGNKFVIQFGKNVAKRYLEPDRRVINNDEGWQAKHGEKIFIAKSILIYELVYFFIFHILLVEYEIVILLWLLLVLLLPFYFIAMWILSEEGLYAILRKHISLATRAQFERDSIVNKIPFATIFLIAVNIVIFYMCTFDSEGHNLVAGNMLFPPKSDNVITIIGALFSSMFLHADQGHLFGNMIFLWGIGVIVERRVGTWRFLLLYLLTGSLADIFGWSLMSLAGIIIVPGLGASGAIAGIMGIFAVRCYFKTISVQIPVLAPFAFVFPFLTYIGFNIYINSLGFFTFFFVLDFMGTMRKLIGGDSGIANHVHLGGMLSGILIAYLSGYHKLALEERYLEEGVIIYESRLKGNQGLAVIDQALQLNRGNAESLLYKARILSRLGKGKLGRDSYEAALTSMLDSGETGSLAPIYQEYSARYNYSSADNEKLLLRLGIHFKVAGNIISALSCFWNLIISQDVSNPSKEKALFYYAAMQERIGDTGKARQYLEILLKDYPMSKFSNPAKNKLRKLGG
jgi:membrane associated rhomboid family serine protease